MCFEFLLSCELIHNFFPQTKIPSFFFNFLNFFFLSLIFYALDEGMELIEALNLMMGKSCKSIYMYIEKYTKQSGQPTHTKKGGGGGYLIPSTSQGNLF